MSGLIVYTDYKSPYAFLAKGRIYALADDTGVEIDWRPYVLDVPRYLGSATVGDGGSVAEADRNPHQWRRIRYMFMDCRRQARKQGLVLRSTRKIWDSRTAAAGMLFAQLHGPEVFRRYHDTVFERFWKRDLDIEDTAALARVLAEAGAGGFEAFLPEGLARVDAIGRAAEADGVFGVPTFILNGEMFWGGEHLPDIRALLRDRDPPAAL
jgi:2-hydroxychromene-2-carboxylate isomerase